MANPVTRNYPINVVSAKRDRFTGQEQLTVCFRVERDPSIMSIDSTFIIPRETDDQDAVRLARDYFYRTMKSLADQTASWELSEEEIGKIVPKTSGR